MLQFITYYSLLAIMFGFILNQVLEQSLQYEYDNEILELFSEKSVRYVSISLLSLFWIITLLAVAYQKWRN